MRPDIATDGVHTRLTGRALVLDDGDTPVVLVATDLGFPLRKDDLVARVADLGYTSATVLYHASHTHAGPEALDDWQVDQLARAIRRAHASRVPVAAGWGTAEVPRVNRNRSVEAHLANHGMDLFPGQGAHDDDPNGAAHTRDTTVRVLRIDRADGSGPLTAWTHFPVHLTTVTPANSLWDADLAGTATWHLAERVEAGQHDDHVDDRDGFTAIYANGAQGDLMPRFDGYNPQALVDLHGRRLARGAHAAYEGGHTVYGTWTSLLARNEFVGLAERLAAGDVEVADGTGSPPTLVAPAPGDGGTRGHLRSGPSGTVERMTVVEVTWTGPPGGLDRPADTPLVALQRRKGGRWDVTTRAWTVRLPDHLAAGVARVAPGGVIDGAGNTNATGYVLDLTAGIAPAEWPDHIGVGGGRTPGPFGEGSFPP